MRHLRRPLGVALILGALVTALLPAAAGAADPPPLPSSMAAVGDSITQAASSGGSLGADYPANSWSTGSNSDVDSHYLRLLSLNAAIDGQNHNRSVSGAKVADLGAQVQKVVELAPQPGYVTVLIGGNDLCTDTEAEMTEVDVFKSHFATAMKELTIGAPGAYVYVVSIPDAYQLWQLFKNNFFARSVWAAGDICQSLLANPTSNRTEDVERRLRVRQRNIDYNTAMAEVCVLHTQCRWDGNAVFNTQIETSDVAGDYFHPSIQGQAKLSAVSWAAGFWGSSDQPNQAPTASFTVACAGFECTFTDTSTDSDGTVKAWSWAFGDGATSTLQNPTHTYKTAESYPVSLTVTDDGDKSATATATVTVPAATTVHVEDLSGASATSGRNSWTATVTITVADDTGALVSDATVAGTWTTGGSTSCTTDANGTCSVSTSLNAKRYSSTTWSVDGIAHSPLAYDSANNKLSSIIVNSP